MLKRRARAPEQFEHAQKKTPVPNKSQISTLSAIPHSLYMKWKSLEGGPARPQSLARAVMLRSEKEKKEGFGYSFLK